MSKKNALEAKRARREVKVIDTSYAPDYWVHIKQILAEDDKSIPRVKLVSYEKALRLTKGFIKMGDQIFKLAPKWEKVYA